MVGLNGLQELPVWECLLVTVGLFVEIHVGCPPCWASIHSQAIKNETRTNVLFKSDNEVIRDMFWPWKLKLLPSFSFTHRLLLALCWECLQLSQKLFLKSWRINPFSIQLTKGTFLSTITAYWREIEKIQDILKGFIFLVQIKIT